MPYKLFRHQLAIHHKHPRFFVDVERKVMIRVGGPLESDPYLLDYYEDRYTERLFNMIVSRERYVEIQSVADLTPDCIPVLEYVQSRFGGGYDEDVLKLFEEQA
jgi:hypothetical protein